MKKYELTNETINFSGWTLYRIRALRDFRNVRKGDFGGYVMSEDNLSHRGNCWIFGQAKVSWGARVQDNAEIHGSTFIHGKTKVAGDAKIFPEGSLFGNIELTGCTVWSIKVRSSGVYQDHLHHLFKSGVVIRDFAGNIDDLIHAYPEWFV